MDSGRFTFLLVVNGAGVRRDTYLCLDSTKNVDKNWDINVSFVIHMNFDHAWAEHYPVTLTSLPYSNICLKFRTVDPSTSPCRVQMCLIWNSQYVGGVILLL